MHEACDVTVSAAARRAQRGHARRLSKYAEQATELECMAARLKRAEVVSVASSLDAATAGTNGVCQSTRLPDIVAARTWHGSTVGVVDARNSTARLFDVLPGSQHNAARDGKRCVAFTL